MSRGVSSTVGTAVRETVPFLAITAVWIVIMLLLYALFLLGKPAGASYGPAIHASVFVPPFVGFLGHTLREALRTP
ncbi:hypothetical protein KM295_10745 [Natronomonas sp. F2-12]|jgi:hypothetical protein|uniref:Uncharacterized protein n=1 Tax=Natronomonas aquatica TaxID=2841590 RepID=A0A9R1CUP9_9EURY|nr:hypothetical protein [Natronomonas aquatica]MCQ4333951.1 hypothetical protein [Natronomonas aquatica]